MLSYSEYDDMTEYMIYDHYDEYVHVLGLHRNKLYFHHPHISEYRKTMLRRIRIPTRSRITMTTTGNPPSTTSITEPTLLHNINTHQLRTYANQAAGPFFHLRILEALKEDHREITAFGDLILKSRDLDEQTRCQNQFTWELARHAVAEELVVYPAMERCVEGGRGVVDRDRGEHQKVYTYPHCLLSHYHYRLSAISSQKVKRDR